MPLTLVDGSFEKVALVKLGASHYRDIIEVTVRYIKISPPLGEFLIVSTLGKTVFT